MDLVGFSGKSHKLHQVKDVTIALLGFVFGKSSWCPRIDGYPIQFEELARVSLKSPEVLKL